MSSPTRIRLLRHRKIVTAIVAVALMVRLVGVPLHLVGHEHWFPGDPPAHDHHHHEGDHSHGDEDDGHVPHSALDHVVPLVDTQPTSDHVDVPILGVAHVTTLVTEPELCSALSSDLVTCPRPPPPRDVASPRAPPVIA